MDSGLAGVVGAGVGVVGTTLAAAVTGLSGQRQVRAEHRQWRRQLRRDAYAELLTLVDDVLRTLTELVNDLLEPSDVKHAHELLDDVRAALNDAVARATATVQMEGPASMADLGSQVNRSLWACVGAVRSQLFALSPGESITSGKAEPLLKFVNHASDNRNQFVELARKTIDV